MQPYLPLLIGLLVVGMVLALSFFLVGRRRDGKAAERLDLLVGRNTRKDSSADMLLKQALREADGRKLLDKLTPEFLNVSKSIEQADANLQPGALVGAGLVIGTVMAVTAVFLVNVYVAPVAALTGLAAPFLWLYYKKTSRMKKFAGQLPEAMELTARALRAGHSLAAGMHVVAEEMPQPIAKEFGRVYEEQNLGIQLEDRIILELKLI